MFSSFGNIFNSGFNGPQSFSPYSNYGDSFSNYQGSGGIYDYINQLQNFAWSSFNNFMGNGYGNSFGNFGFRDSGYSNGFGGFGFGNNFGYGNYGNDFMGGGYGGSGYNAFGDDILSTSSILNHVMQSSGYQDSYQDSSSDYFSDSTPIGQMINIMHSFDLEFATNIAASNILYRESLDDPEIEQPSNFTTFA